jgi:hypothetical protein
MDTTTTPNPEPGTMVRYHGSQPLHHGIWRVRGAVRFGDYARRLILENPENTRETLTISAGNASITVLDGAQ